MTTTEDEGPLGVKIGELIKATGVTRATIHHYVKEGLLPEPRKTSRNMALYGRDCVDRILLIKGLQKHSRRSLAEVKSLLEGTSGLEGIQRMREQLDIEATRAQASPLNPERVSDALSITVLAERTGFSLEQIREMESLGLITSHSHRGRKLFDPTEIDVVDALAKLAEVGFSRDAGFIPKDAVIYLEALRNLLYQEVAIFLERLPDGSDPQEVLTLARKGVERVSPLLLALRRKLIREFIEAAPLPPSNPN